MATIEIPNPDYSGQAFGGPERVAAFSSGVQAVWAPLARSGEFRPTRFVFGDDDWTAREDCEAWVERHREDAREVSAQHDGTRVLEVEVDRTYGPEPTEEDLALINEFALEPLTADEVYVRRMRLVHDDFHRDFQRFSRGVLAQLVDSIPGKSLLEGHDYSRAGIGLMFRGETQRDAKRTDGYAYFYIRKTPGTEHARTQIDSGVWRYVSVGFMWDWVQCDICGLNYMGDPDEDGNRCPHWIGEAYPLDELTRGADPANYWLTDDEREVYCTITYRGKAETTEGSIVYLGALQDAEIVRSMVANNDLTRRKRAALGLPPAPVVAEKVSGDAEDAPGDETGEASGDTRAFGEQGDAPDTPDPTPGDTQGATQADEAGERAMAEEKQLEELQTKLEEREERVAELKSEVETKDADIRDLREKLDTVSEQEAALRAHQVAELERLAGLTGNEANLDAYRDLAEEDLRDMSVEKLLALIEDWTEQYDEKRPDTQSSPADVDEPTTDDNPDEEPRDVRRSSLI